MSQKSKIQWCDSTINPVMGCDGCELYPSPSQIRQRFLEALLAKYPKLNRARFVEALRGVFADFSTTEIWHERKNFVNSLSKVHALPPEDFQEILKLLEKHIKCYAAKLHFRHGHDHTQLRKKTNKGYARQFEVPALFPGRTTEAANWKNLAGTDREGSPWLNGLPRLIFVSDMGDALSRNVSFEYLKTEIVDCALSAAGSAHIWLWLTKRPQKMAKFSNWLEERYGADSWPDNLVAMTSATSQKTSSRIDDLRKVRARFRGLSVEPLWEAVSLNLDGISWVICGGESGDGAEPFDVTWAQSLSAQAKEADTAFFLKQLGTSPRDAGTPIKLRDTHGGDWAEWPEALKIREFPSAWYSFAIQH